MAVLSPDIAKVFDEPEYRVEGPLKVMGRARYAGDLQLPARCSQSAS